MRDSRVDAYIARQQPFARPILKFLRAAVHEGCPDVEETMKWGMPSFTHHGILAGMAGFKEHATFGFWKHRLVMGSVPRTGMSSIGKLTSTADLPSRSRMVALVRKAARLNEAGVAVKRPPRKARPAIPMPPVFRAALAKNKKAKAAFNAFPPSHKREYLEWITEAKRLDTRDKRIAQAVAWIAQGKQRNWKYA